MRIVSVCYREEKTHNREIAIGRRRIIERLLSRENAISESLLSGEDANENKSIFGCYESKK